MMMIRTGVVGEREREREREEEKEKKAMGLFWGSGDVIGDVLGRWNRAGKSFCTVLSCLK